MAVGRSNGFVECSLVRCASRPVTARNSPNMRGLRPSRPRLTDACACSRRSGSRKTCGSPGGATRISTCSGVWWLFAGRGTSGAALPRSPTFRPTGPVLEMSYRAGLAAHMAYRGRRADADAHRNPLRLVRPTIRASGVSFDIAIGPLENKASQRFTAVIGVQNTRRITSDHARRRSEGPPSRIFLP